MLVGFLGPRGTFTEMATLRFFESNGVEFIPFKSISEVFVAVEKSRIDYGVVPVENSTEGSVGITLERLYKSPLKICGEIQERVKHSLIIKPETKLRDVKLVLSHPQALSQCREFIEKKFKKAKIVEVESTAQAVWKLKRLKNAAAIGPERAASFYGMKVAATNIGSLPKNYTRFLVLGYDECPPTGRDKTSIIFSTKNVPGALYSALEPFARRSINLTKIESRPMLRKAWEYIFFLDFEGHRSDASCAEALNEMRRRCSFYKMLGSYPRAI